MLDPLCTNTPNSSYVTSPFAFASASDMAADTSRTSGYSTNWFSLPRPNGTYSNRFSCAVNTSGATSTVNCFVARVMCGFRPGPPISHLYLFAPSRVSIAT